jgi:hypothetical protein
MVVEARVQKLMKIQKRGRWVTSNTSCKVTNDDCLQFVLDYPIAGLNFDCSSDKVNHFVTKLESNVMTGACKVGDTVSFYIQGKDARKITLGNVKLDDIYKSKRAKIPITKNTFIDIASSLTGQMPTTIDQNNETIRVALALVKIFHSIGLEQEDNIWGIFNLLRLLMKRKIYYLN